MAQKSIVMVLRVTAPAGMSAREIRREVLTRINAVTGHFSAGDLDLPWRAEGEDGNLRIRAILTRTGGR